MQCTLHFDYKSTHFLSFLFLFACIPSMSPASISVHSGVPFHPVPSPSPFGSFPPPSVRPLNWPFCRCVWDVYCDSPGCPSCCSDFTGPCNGDKEPRRPASCSQQVAGNAIKQQHPAGEEVVKRDAAVVTGFLSPKPVSSFTCSGTAAVTVELNKSGGETEAATVRRRQYSLQVKDGPDEGQTPKGREREEQRTDTDNDEEAFPADCQQRIKWTADGGQVAARSSKPGVDCPPPLPLPVFDECSSKGGNDDGNHHLSAATGEAPLPKSCCLHTAAASDFADFPEDELTLLLSCSGDGASCCCPHCSAELTLGGSDLTAVCEHSQQDDDHHRVDSDTYPIGAQPEDGQSQPHLQQHFTASIRNWDSLGHGNCCRQAAVLRLKVTTGDGAFSNEPAFYDPDNKCDHLPGSLSECVNEQQCQSIDNFDLPNDHYSTSSPAVEVISEGERGDCFDCDDHELSYHCRHPASWRTTTPARTTAGNCNSNDESEFNDQQHASSCHRPRREHQLHHEKLVQQLLLKPPSQLSTPLSIDCTVDTSPTPPPTPNVLLSSPSYSSLTLPPAPTTLSSSQLPAPVSPLSVFGQVRRLKDLPRLRSSIVQFERQSSGVFDSPTVSSSPPTPSAERFIVQIKSLICSNCALLAIRSVLILLYLLRPSDALYLLLSIRLF